jgi:hypothetical protein
MLRQNLSQCGSRVFAAVACAGSGAAAVDSVSRDDYLWNLAPDLPKLPGCLMIAARITKNLAVAPLAIASALIIEDRL